MDLLSTRYSVQRRPLDDPDDAPTRRLACGSLPPPNAVRGLARTQRIGEHDVEIQRDGEHVTIALAGALRLRGRPDQIRALAACLLATLDAG
jgi:hypothetical protein